MAGFGDLLSFGTAAATGGGYLERDEEVESPLCSPLVLHDAEYRVLPPGLEFEPSDDDVSAVYSAPARTGDDPSVATRTTSNRIKRRGKSRRGALLIASALIIFVVAAVAMVWGGSSNRGAESDNDSKRDGSRYDVAPTHIDDGDNITGGVTPKDAEETMGDPQDSDPDPAPANDDGDGAGVTPNENKSKAVDGGPKP